MHCYCIVWVGLGLEQKKLKHWYPYYLAPLNISGFIQEFMRCMVTKSPEFTPYKRLSKYHILQFQKQREVILSLFHWISSISIIFKSTILNPLLGQALYPYITLAYSTQNVTGSWDKCFCINVKIWQVAWYSDVGGSGLWAWEWDWQNLNNKMHSTHFLQHVSLLVYFGRPMNQSFTLVC